jgi:Xaa-Pro aminopeptidase
MMSLDDELATKRARLRATLDALELDGLLLATPASVSWITCGGDPVVDVTAPQGVAAVLCTRDGETLLTNTIEHARLLEEALPRPPEHVEVFGWYESVTPEVARRLRPGARFGCDLALAGFEDCEVAARALRLVLTTPEQERYRALCRAAGMAAETYDRGMTPIVVLVATDERVWRYRHPIPTARQLERYALLVLCARRHGLVANVTRAVHFGAIPDDLARRQEACARVDAAFLAATQPGRTAGDVFAAGAAANAGVAVTPPGWRHRLCVA